MNVLFVDHEDSFSYNVVYALKETGFDVNVVMWNEVHPDKVYSYDLIVLSPGPASPEAYPTTLRMVQRVAGTVPVWGVCLGHQALAGAFGGSSDTRRKDPFRGYPLPIGSCGTILWLWMCPR